MHLLKHPGNGNEPEEDVEPIVFSSPFDCWFAYKNGLQNMILDSKCTTPRGMDFSEGLQQGALQGVFVGKVDRPADTRDHPDVTNLKMAMIFIMVMMKNVNRRHRPGN